MRAIQARGERFLHGGNRANHSQAMRVHLRHLQPMRRKLGRDSLHSFSFRSELRVELGWL